MAHPIIFDGTDHREMTDAEYANYVKLQNYLEKEQAKKDAAQADKIAAAASGRTKLAALGLTEAEVNALLGGV